LFDNNLFDLLLYGRCHNFLHYNLAGAHKSAASCGLVHKDLILHHHLRFRVLCNDLVSLPNSQSFSSPRATL
jgi:hypothetical protein